MTSSEIVRLAELQALQDKLLAALGRPESEIEFEQRRTRFKPTAELVQALSALSGEIAALAGCREPRKFTLSLSEGLWPVRDCCCGGGE